MAMHAKIASISGFNLVQTVPIAALLILSLKASVTADVFNRRL